MDELLTKVKQNLIVEHAVDDALIRSYIAAAVSYAESYQHIPAGSYTEKAMPFPGHQSLPVWKDRCPYPLLR